MPTIVGFLNLKGGVGKTHISILASLALADAGKRVLVKDFDPQGSISEIFLGWDGLLNLEKRVRDKYGIDTGFRLTWLALSDAELTNYKASGVFNDIIVPVRTSVGRIDIFPVLPKHYADTLSMVYGVVETKMYEFFKDLDEYDYIIIDLPPQPIPPTKEVMKVIDVVIPPVVYNHVSSIRPAQLLIANAFLNKEVVQGRMYYGEKIPYVPGTVVNMVTKRQVSEGKLKPGLPFLRVLSKAMYKVYVALESMKRNPRLSNYIDLERIWLVEQPYIPDVPIYKSYKARATSINEYVEFYKSFRLQRDALRNLVSLLEKIRRG